MKKKTTPLVQQGWLRALLFFIALVIANFALYHFLLQDQSRGYEERFSILPALSLFEGMIILGSITTVILVFVFCKVIDRKELVQLGLTSDTRGTLTGFFLAGALLGIASMILYAIGNLRWIDSNSNWKELFTMLVMMVLIAFSEELAFRGYILGNLLRSFSRWPAILFSAAGFVLMHAANPGMEVTAIINLLLGGIVLGQCFTINNNCWMPVAFHFAWNFFQGPVLGFRVSGIELTALLEQQLSGNEWMTGGEFGFEGSLVATMILISGVCILEWRFTQRRKELKAQSEVHPLAPLLPLRL